ncbi:hypothetical protein A4D02_15715 [Niastella koreensis]|nr:hypothetical protein A4D02_15715 [Niastella koreensis]
MTLILLVACISCKKDFLTKNPSSEFITADNLEKIGGLLKDDVLMGETPILGELSSDDYFLNPGRPDQLLPVERNAYNWQHDIYEGEGNIPDWNTPYKQVYYCNTALEKLDAIKGNIDPTQQTIWKQIRGAALFMRAYAFFNLAQIFATPYDKGTAHDVMGIPMPLSSDISYVPDRSMLQVCYDKIISDVREAAGLLPDTLSLITRSNANKPAAYALLARVFMSQRNYKVALIFADSCLSYQKSLIDFNSLKAKDKFPIAEINNETLYRSWMISNSNVIQGGKVFTETIIDSTLYKMYEKNDLRRNIYFGLNGKTQPIFGSNYSGKSYAFSGLATDEMYLVRAECNARDGLIDTAMGDINHLLQFRYKTGTFVTYNAQTIKEALDIILKERRKELVFRGLRWIDLRRLNKEEAGIILTRLVDGNTYTLLPISNKYTLPIPPDALSGSSIRQNDRE